MERRLISELTHLVEDVGLRGGDLRGGHVLGRAAQELHADALEEGDGVHVTRVSPRHSNLYRAEGGS